MRKRWTPADDAAIIEGSRNRTPLRQTAERLGRSVKSISTRHARLVSRDLIPKYVPKLWTPDEDKKLADLIRQGNTTLEIVVEMRRGHHSIDARKRTLGLTRKALGVDIGARMIANPPNKSGFPPGADSIRMIVTPWQTLPDGTLRRLIYRAGDEAAATAIA